MPDRPQYPNHSHDQMARIAEQAIARINKGGIKYLGDTTPEARMDRAIARLSGQMKLSNLSPATHLARQARQRAKLINSS